MAKHTHRPHKALLRMFVRAGLALLLLGISPHALAEPQDTLAQRMAPCLVCHADADTDLSADYVPPLHGKPAGYLYNQLLHYRAHRRNNPVMTAMVRNLSDDYLWAMATYLSEQAMSFEKSRTSTVGADVLALGETLVTQGDPAKDIPACQSCHGPRLTGVLPNTPGLVGLPSHYLAAQLGAWRQGTRQAAAPDCMRSIAKRLSPQDIEAVSNWLASRPLPADPTPTTEALSDPPMDCGSVSLPGGRP
ncbi:MAG: c-type cytochrome [Algiphilus sp.]|uniref:c-type cytochrome n=1 Tax=Algiphilus sp. TaxID=1872431 RepID=UPI0032F0619D